MPWRVAEVTDEAVIELWRNKGSGVAREKWSEALRHEVANLDNERAVRGPIRVRSLPGGGLGIFFSLLTDQVFDSPVAAILDEEPIVLLYPHGQVGSEAPKVYSDRIDFPKSLPHLNPVPSSSPVSICLAREGHQALYERNGITGFIYRLRSWLRDAKTGSLNHDGWEPVPVSEGAALGFIDGGGFQDFALGAGDSPSLAWGTAEPTADGNAFFIQTGVLTLHREFCDEILARMLTQAAIAAEGKRSNVPLLFAWQPSTSCEATFAFQKYERLSDLLQDLGRLKILSSVTEGFECLRRSTKWVEVEATPSAMIVVVGVRRPKPMIPEPYGFSRNLEARCLELKAFLISAESPETVFEADAAVREVGLYPWPTSSLLADVSGANPGSAVSVLGYGALGSEVAGFLRRMGVPEVKVIDNDTLASHNLARHEGTCLELGLPKIVVHERLTNWLIPAKRTRSSAFAKDILTTSDSDLIRFVGSNGILIDATANDRVRRMLPSLARKASSRLLRIELFDDGYLGVQSIEGEDGNPDLIDLYYWLCQRGVADEHVKNWLNNERNRNDGSDAIVAGFACASASVRMPKWRVASHASAFMPQITALLENKAVPAGIGVNVVARTGHPQGWHWLDVGRFAIEQPRVRGDRWSVRIAPGVLEQMALLRDRCAPNETGGYLYGGWDPNLYRITVTAITPQPPGTKTGPVSLELAPAGLTNEERRIRKHCAGRIALVGTWHTHPKGGEDMSGRDQRTARDFHQLNQKRGLPTLVMICGANRTGVHLLP